MKKKISTRKKKILTTWSETSNFLWTSNNAATFFAWEKKKKKFFRKFWKIFLTWFAARAIWFPNSLIECRALARFKVSGWPGGALRCKFYFWKNDSIWKKKKKIFLLRGRLHIEKFYLKDRWGVLVNLYCDTWCQSILSLRNFFFLKIFFFPPHEQKLKIFHWRSNLYIKYLGLVENSEHIPYSEIILETWKKKNFHFFFVKKIFLTEEINNWGMPEIQGQFKKFFSSWSLRVVWNSNRDWEKLSENSWGKKKKFYLDIRKNNCEISIR